MISTTNLWNCVIQKWYRKKGKTEGKPLASTGNYAGEYIEILGLTQTNKIVYVFTMLIIKHFECGSIMK